MKKTIKHKAENEKKTLTEEKIKLLSTAVEQCTEGIAVVDLKGNLSFVNEAFASMHGFHQQELIGKNLSIFHTPEQIPSVDAAKKQIQETGEFIGEIWHVKRDGSVFPTMMHNSILRDEKGDPVGMIGTLRDITQRKQAEQALKESEEKYRSLIANIPDVIWSTDIEGNTSFISSNVEKVYGFKQEEIYEAGDNLWFGRIHPDDIERVKGKFKELFESKNKQLDVEYRIKRKDGKWIWLRDRSTGNYEKHGIKFADGIFSEITERKQAEEDIKKRNEELELFNRMAVGRELKMIELKKEINSLLEKAGEKPAYEIAE